MLADRILKLAFFGELGPPVAPPTPVPRKKLKFLVTILPFGSIQ